MDNIEIITKRLLEFRRKRDWKKFHKPKDLALSLVLEVSELLEQFQWKSEKEVNEYVKFHKEELGEELVDILHWVLLMAHDFGINITDVSLKKIRLNNKKYPVQKAKGNPTKYNRL